MDRRRLGLAGGGLAAFVLANLTADVPLFEGAVGAVVRLLGNDYLLVVALAAPALAAATLVVASGRAGNLDQASMPEPERPATAPVAGDEFDATLRAVRTYLPVVGRERRRGVHDRLRRAAVATVQRSDRVSTRAARERVARGEWTDDRAVAAFLAAETPPSPSLGERTAALLRGEPWFRHRVRRAAREIVAYWEGGP